MQKEFIKYEQALDLKELGFDEPCLAYRDCDWNFIFSHNKNTFLECELPLPLYQQAFRWFREKYELYSFVFKFDEGFGYETYKEGITQTNESFDTYEEAELACLEKLIEIIKENK